MLKVKNILEKVKINKNYQFQKIISIFDQIIFRTETGTGHSCDASPFIFNSIHLLASHLQTEASSDTAKIVLCEGEGGGRGRK